MGKGICSVEGCDRDVLSRDWCAKHYTRWSKYGDPLIVGKMGRPKGPVVICSIDGCEHEVAANGWCDTHYRRWKKSGDPLVTKRIIGDVEARFWSKVDRRGDDECWLWLDPPNPDGYGVFGVGQKVVKAHVWAYERYVKPVPPGMMLDHILANGCTHRNCVNYICHLEPVTNRENVLRGSRTKLSDEAILVLHARWRAGESAVALAAETGTNKATLYKRFRIAAAEQEAS